MSEVVRPVAHFAQIARRGMAGSGLAGQGKARQGKARQGKARQGCWLARDTHVALINGGVVSEGAGLQSQGLPWGGIISFFF